MSKPCMAGRAAWAVVVLGLVSGGSVWTERLNTRYIEETGHLSLWYFATNLGSSLCGFLVEVVLPWCAAGLITTKRSAFGLWLWCIAWDNCWRLVWYVHERYERMQGMQLITRWPILFEAAGNDVNSLLLVPGVCVLLLPWIHKRHDVAPGEQDSFRSVEEGGCRGEGALLALCALVSGGFVLLDAVQFCDVRKLWWLHSLRFGSLLLLLPLAQYGRGGPGSAYGCVLLVNLLGDWKWASVRLALGHPEEKTPLYLLKAAIFTPGFLLLLWASKQLTRDCTKEAKVFRFYMVVYKEYYMLALFLQGEKPALVALGAFAEKVLNKTLVLYPGVKASLTRHAKALACASWPCSTGRHAGAQQMAHALRSRGGPLPQLHLRDCQLSNSWAVEFAQEHATGGIQIGHMDLSHNNIRSSGAARLIEECGADRLDLSHNPIGRAEPMRTRLRRFVVGLFAPGSNVEEEEDWDGKALLLSHVSSTFACLAVAVALGSDWLADMLLGAESKSLARRDKRWELTILLAALFLAELLLLGVHLSLGKCGLRAWGPELPYWADLLGSKAFFWSCLAALSLCIFRSHETLLTYLAVRSDQHEHHDTAKCFAWGGYWR